MIDAVNGNKNNEMIVNVVPTDGYMRPPFFERAQYNFELDELKTVSFKTITFLNQ